MANLPIWDAAHAYDEYASRYDLLLTENRINAYMRRSMNRVLLSTFKPGDRLLELGCGTGDDAIALAIHGCEVLAFDPSPKMIEVAATKAASNRAARTVRFFVGRGADLMENSPDIPQGETFDGAYACFSLSYESNLDQVASGLARRVRVDGRLLIAAMNRLCGVEFAIALLSAHPSLAGRRFARRTLHKVGGYATSVFPRTTAELVEPFRKHFVLEDARALPAILPPHYANRLLARWPSVVEILSEVDPHLGPLPIVRWLGDHNLLRLRRKR